MVKLVDLVDLKSYVPVNHVPNCKSVVYTRFQGLTENHILIGGHGFESRPFRHQADFESPVYTNFTGVADFKTDLFTRFYIYFITCL